MNNREIGARIAALRTAKGLTQNELGERIGVNFQAVSKWERGETLPDVGTLPALANILEITIDRLLCGDKSEVVYKGKMQMQNLIDGLHHLKQMGLCLGRNNLIYRYSIAGINNGMNTDVEPAFEDDFIFEAFLAEAIIQNLKDGYYVDLSDNNRHFKHDHFRNIVVERAKQFGNGVKNSPCVVKDTRGTLFYLR